MDHWKCSRTCAFLPVLVNLGFLQRLRTDIVEGSGSDALLASWAMVPLASTAQLPEPSAPSPQARPSLTVCNSTSMSSTVASEGLVLNIEDPRLLLQSHLHSLEY